MTRRERTAAPLFLVVACTMGYFHGELAATSFMVVGCFFGIWTLMEEVRGIKRALKVKEEKEGD
jgi:hypothetical protein